MCAFVTESAFYSLLVLRHRSSSLVLHYDSLCRNVKIRGEKIGNSELAEVSIQFDKYLLRSVLDNTA